MERDKQRMVEGWYIIYCERKDFCGADYQHGEGKCGVDPTVDC